jgi:uncharacterized repeat protein (TIGR01451 family)
MLALVLCFLGAGQALARPADGAEQGMLPVPRIADRAGGAARPTEFSPLAGTVGTLQAAADWLITQQTPNGSLPWTVGGGVFPNTQGATGRGWLQAHAHTQDPAHLAAAEALGDCFLAGNACIPGFRFAHGGHRFAAHDPLFLIELSQATGNPAYAALVDSDFWNRLEAGTYGLSEDQDAPGYVAVNIANRTSQGIPELVPWDLSKGVIAAHLAGRSAIRDALLDGVLAGLELASPSFQSVDVIALAGGLWAAAAVGVDLDPATGTWAAASSNADLAQALLAFQTPGGGFVTGSGQPLIDDNASGQTTAFAMQALYALDPFLYRNEINQGFAFIASLQQPSGQFLYGTGGSSTDPGGVEVHGETLEAYAIAWIRPDRYVAPTGADIGDCSFEAEPCLTLQYAVDQADAGNTIFVFSGTYPQGAVVPAAKSGLRIVGHGPTRPVFDRSSGPTNQVLIHLQGATGVTLENLRFDVDRSFVAEAVLCDAGCTGLSVLDSHFVQRRSSLASSSYGRTNAISAIGAGPSGASVTVQGNTIAFDPASAIQTAFRAGVAIDFGHGIVGGDQPGQGNDIVATNHDVIAREVRGGDLLIAGNVLRGFGVQITTPEASAGAIEVLDNLFQPLTPPPAPIPAGDLSAMRLISNASGASLRVAGNVFDGHERGVLVQNFPGVTLEYNQFTPRSGSSTFVHLVLSNKELFSNAVPPLPLPQSLQLIARGNTFNGGDVAGGTAIRFLNDNAQGAPPGGYYGPIVFGGAAPGEANAFTGDFARYFELGNFECASSNASPCPLAALYVPINPAMPGTPVIKFAGDVTAIHNLFQGVLPADMDAAQRNQLLARTQDQRGDGDLGLVDYGITATQPMTFVDDDFAGAGYGDAFTFNHNDPAVDGQTVYFGIDAFATIGDGIAAVEAGGTVYVASGTYAESVTVAKPLSLIGNGSGNTTVIEGALTVTVSGSAGDPILFRDFVVSNPAGDGLALGGGREHLRFEGVAFDANQGVGVNLVGTGINAIAFAGPGCRFSGNTIGVRTATTTTAANVSFDGCLFEDNERGGIVLFGASGSGNGQIVGWLVENSQFIGNDSSDATPFGGGIWLKTGGAGSAIVGFVVADSLFRDNGSATALNGNGIAIRARPNTTLSGVQICGSSFENTTAGGTQRYGITVFDDTGNSGYQPVEVCASNGFAGLDASVSGTEQYALRGTQPVVIVNGGTLAGGEFINDPVLRFSDGALFATFNAAIADAGTSAGETLRGGVGLYAENIVVTKDALTIEGIGEDTVIEGTTGPESTPVTSTQPGILMPSGRTDTTVRNLVVRNFDNACIEGANANHRSLVEGVLVQNCQAGGGKGGIYFNGIAGLEDLTIRDSEVVSSGSRGIVVWNGFKRRISITGNTVRDLTGCCGIELQDGTASGVRIANNLVTNTGDNGIGVVGLRAGDGANLIYGNVVENRGRFGIEIKLPDGSGVDVPDADLEDPVVGLPDGAIVVANNVVALDALGPTDVRDIAGIAVFRRGFLPGNADIPVGVVVRNNTVSGWSQPSANDGFGIVAEGNGHRVFGNLLDGNDVPTQLQAGNDGYPGDSDQNATNDFFSRGNAPVTCSFVGENTVDGDSAFGPSRTVSDPPGQGLQAGVVNLDTGMSYCSIGAAIADPATQDGHTLSVAPGVYAENVAVDKSLTIQGPFAGTPGQDASRDGSGEAVVQPASGDVFTVSRPGVVIEGLTITTSNGRGVTIAGSSRNDLVVRDNRFVDLIDATGFFAEPGDGNPASGFQIRDNLFHNVRGGGPVFGRGVVLFKGTLNAVVQGNVIDGAQTAGIQVNGGNGVIDGVLIAGNTIRDSGALGAGTAIITTNTRNATVRDNAVSGTTGGLFLSDSTLNLQAFCNVLDGSVSSINASDFFGNAPNSGVRIFHNEVRSELRNGMAQGLTIGSNWYGGGPPPIGSPAVGLQVADPTAVNPIGDPLCGDDTPVQLVAASGGDQSTPIGAAFADPLVARVLDVFGGAVAGATVDFEAPASGASAALDPSSAVSDFNGQATTEATANLIAGPYQVLATAGALGPAAFALENLQGASTVALLIADPSPSAPGEPTRFEFSVSPPQASGDVEVRRLADNVLVCTGSVASGDCTGVPGSAVGSVDLVAYYLGDANHLPSVSPTFPHPIAKIPTELELAVQTPFPDFRVEDTVTFTWTVTPARTDFGTLSGTVIVGKGFDSCSAPVQAGQCSLTLTEPGEREFVAIYLGNAVFEQSQDVVVIEVLEQPREFAFDAAISKRVTHSLVLLDGDDLVRFRILVENVGPDDIVGALVSDPLPVQLVDGQWICEGFAGGLCGNASGQGDILEEAVDLPVGASVVFTLEGRVVGLPAWGLVNEALVEVEDDVDLGNNIGGTTYQRCSASNLQTDPDDEALREHACIFVDGYEASGE